MGPTEVVVCKNACRLGAYAISRGLTHKGVPDLGFCAWAPKRLDTSERHHGLVAWFAAHIGTH